MIKFLILILCLVGLCVCSYRNDGFKPSPSYVTEDQLAEPSGRSERGSSKTYSSGIDNNLSADATGKSYDRNERFGITYGSPGGAEGSFGGTGTAVMTPLKLDLGGVLLGTVLGFTAVIIIPKLINSLTYGYGGYGRSIDGGLSNELTDMLTTLDEILTRYNVDTSTCMQRVACSYVQLAQENSRAGNASDFDVMLDSISENSFIAKFLNGTPIMEAISAGKSESTDCENKYSKCKLDKKTLVKILAQILPST